MTEACPSFRRRIVLDSRFRGNDVMPALRLRSGQAPAGIQRSLSLGNPLRTLLRQRANYAQSSTYLCAAPHATLPSYAQTEVCCSMDEVRMKAAVLQALGAF